jgi:tripartite-type tricarboxylate transporter receptor subunit TctC
MQHVKAGSVRALGVTSARPSPLVPGLDPVAATGVPGYEVDLWWGVMGPPGIAPALLAKINADINRGLATQELKDTFAKEGAEPWPQPADQYGGVIRRDIERWKKVAKDANIKVD